MFILLNAVREYKQYFKQQLILIKFKGAEENSFTE